jgi:hypothetical protein
MDVGSRSGATLVSFHAREVEKVAAQKPFAASKTANALSASDWTPGLARRPYPAGRWPASRLVEHYFLT